MATTTGSGEVRPLDPEDVDALIELVRVCDIADTGEPDLSRADVVASLKLAGTSGWSLRNPAGDYLAAVWVETLRARQSLNAEFFVHPEQDPAVALPLVDRMLAVQRADERRRPLHVMVNAEAGAKADVLRRRGGKIVRHFFKMAIPLDGTSGDAPSWPDDVTLHPVADRDEDLRSMHAVIGEAFQDHWDHADSPYDDWQQRHRAREDFDPSLWWLVRVAGEPAAGLIGTTVEGNGFVGALGVRRGYRGRGLARRLLLTSFAEFRRRGYGDATLFVDGANPTGAVALYESVGMRAVTRWDCVELVGSPAPAAAS